MCVGVCMCISHPVESLWVVREGVKGPDSQVSFFTLPASFLPSLPLSPLLAGEQVCAAFPLVSRDDVEEEAADQQEQRLSQGQLGSVSLRLLAAVPGREGGEGGQVKKKKVSPVFVAYGRLVLQLKLLSS